MVSLPIAHRAPRAPSGRLGSLRAKLADFTEMLGAAIRVSRAVEARMPAAPDDLAILGIKDQLPQRW